MFKWVKLGFAVGSLLMTTVPQILEDGKVSADECFTLLKDVFALFGVPLSFDVPDELRSSTIATRLLE